MLVRAIDTHIHDQMAGASRYRWPEQVSGSRLVKALGGQWHGDHGTAPCPACQPEGRHDQRALSVRSTPGRLLLFCHKSGCAYPEIFGAAGIRVSVPEPRPRSATGTTADARCGDAGRVERDRRFVANVMARSEPLEGTPGAAYLAWRGCRTPQNPDAVRYVPVVRHPSGLTVPALAAMLTDAISGETAGVHLIALTPDGTGKSTLTPRKWTRGHMRKAIFRLWRDETVTNGLGIAEGIKTALCVARCGWEPVWACLSAGNLAGFPVLGGIEALTVFADAGKTGQRAAYVVAQRWAEDGREARIITPKAADDWAETRR